jgi:hypothetical protein
MVRARLRLNRELLMTPDHPCYVLDEGQLRLKRADELTVGDWIPIATSWDSVANTTVKTCDLIVELKRLLSPAAQCRWRIFGQPIRHLIAARGDAIRMQASEVYSQSTMHNWRKHAYLPLRYVSADDFTPTERAELKIGSGRLNGGEIQRIPAVVSVDEDLGFLLGFFVRVPRIDRTELVSHKMANLKLGQATKKRHRFTPWMRDRASCLELLLSSPLGFTQITSVEKVAYAEESVYCFEVDGDQAAFFVEGGILTHNCFGYQGYKNARFGQIEAHECTTALGREMLLRAKDVAESQGYTMLHALVDSLWLQKPGATRADYDALAGAIAAATDIPIAVEGVYRWIAFVPSRTHPLVGVPNRYFGVFEDGADKVRGLELRRGDTPLIVAAMQRRMLDLLFKARTLDEVHGCLSALLGLLEEQCIRLRQHEVRAEELVIRTVLSQDPREYERAIPQAIAAHQLVHAGVALHPGEAIEYIITNAAARVPEDRAVAYARLPDDWSYDVDRYTDMLRRAAQTLIAPFQITPPPPPRHHACRHDLPESACSAASLIDRHAVRPGCDFQEIAPAEQPIDRFIARSRNYSRQIVPRHRGPGRL